MNKIPPRFRTRLLQCLILVMVVSGPFSMAQLTDNFSDGDFTNNPEWVTDNPANWTIDNLRLRSNSQVSNHTFCIATTSTKVTNAQWEFLVHLQFNTSSANYVDVFLVSENGNLLDPGNSGYFVRIGGTPDDVSLYRLTNGSAAIIINGTDGVTNSSNNLLRVKVTRDASDLWTLSYDNTGTGNDYFDEAPVTDNTFNTGNFFGFRITQSTASFFNRHFFDDIYVGEIVLDVDPPLLLSAAAISSTELAVMFNEKVELTVAESVLNYAVDNGIGQPVSAALQADGRTVHLTFATSFPNAATLELTVNNVTDLAGNAMAPTTTSFFFFTPEPAAYKDVIFTELFPDPSPVIGLPEAEFIELHNRSTLPVDLAGWKFSVPTSTAILPSYVLMPGSYVVVASAGSTSLFTSGSVIGVSNFPTLNNSGDHLVLRDVSDSIIDEVNYTDFWYSDDDKRQGGWTLELIDPENICAESENWVASEDESGGTPGRQNSVIANKPDVTGPILLSAIPIGPSTLKLIFNEKLERQIPQPESFVLTPFNPVLSVSYASAIMRELIIDVENAFVSDETYLVAVSGIRDCAGNLVQEDFNTALFGFPQEASEFDVVINEILFNPRPFGVDFLEIYNRSHKYINLKDWSIGNFIDGNATNLRLITSDDFLIPPQSILAFTVDPLTIKSHYPLANSNALISVSALPAFPDNEGTAALVDGKGLVIDNMKYDQGYHSVFIRVKEGASLERIRADASGNDSNNWKSAASAAGFATPGYPNSNAVNAEPVSGEVNVVPEIFVPLFGQPDFAEIRYNFDQGGRVANIRIVDHQGREIRLIANNETLATEGFYRWDGDLNDGTKARPGYYVVWFEVFDSSGRVDTFRKRVVVAARY